MKMIDEVNKTIALIWGVEDITQRTEEWHEAILSDEEGWKILKKLYRYHDCNYGLTWEHIDVEIDIYLRQQREAK